MKERIAKEEEEYALKIRRDQIARLCWGINEGRRRGVKKGRDQYAISVVQELAERGFSDEEIVAIAKIKPEELEEFKNADLSDDL